MSLDLAREIIHLLLLLLLNSIILYIITDKFLVLDDSRFIKAVFLSAIGLGFNYLISYLAGDPSGFTRTILTNITKYFLAYLPLFIIVKIAYQMSWDDFIYFFVAQLLFALPIKIIVLPHVSLFVSEIIEVLPWFMHQ